MAVIKDFYEAYTIYQFLSFLIAVLGRGDRNAVVDLLVSHGDHLEPPLDPFKCCRKGKRKWESDHAMANAVLIQYQFFAMQFVLIRPLTTIGTFICNNTLGKRSVIDYTSPQFWFMIIENVSVYTAFFGLLKFYHAIHNDLTW